MAATWRLLPRRPASSTLAARVLHPGSISATSRFPAFGLDMSMAARNLGGRSEQTAGDNMAAMSHRARTRVICKVFIKATPQAVWDAICPAVKKHGIARIRSSFLSFELRDTLTGYTAVTVSYEPDRTPGAQQSGADGAHGWDRLLTDLKTAIEADRREGHRTVLTRSSPRVPLQLRPKPVPEVVALSGGRLSPG